MKHRTKILLGLLPLLAIAVFLLVPAKKALAVVTAPQANLNGATFTFIDRAHIQATFSDGTTATFTDGKVDGDYTFKADTSAFCSIDNGGLKDKLQEIHLQNGSQIPMLGAENDPVTNATIDVNIMVKTALQAAGVCKEVPSSQTPVVISISNPNNAAGVVLTGDSNGLTTVSDVSMPNGETIVANTTYSPGISSDRLLLGASTDINSCFGGSVAIINPNDSTQATIYKLSSGGLGVPVNKVPALQNYFGAGGKCVFTGSEVFGVGATLSGSVGGGVGPGGTTPGQSCEKNFNGTFSWIMCEALKLADDTAAGINGFVQDQLTVCTGTSSTTKQPCAGTNLLTTQVHQAWSIFRIIASALLVIVLLIAVIAEAVGGGSKIDAYTIRKALPRLVAAVIFIQLSWVAFKWAIDLSNDLGKGIQDLLYAPFGGAGHMNLDTMLGQGTSTSINNKFAFFVTIAGAVAVIANLPGLLLLALYVVVALFTAFIVLIVRKIMIILFVILAPLAILAWILPGTDTYWKTWKDNFIKLLAMFPLIMGMIAGGRIFAFIASGSTVGSIFKPHLAIVHLGALPIPYVANATDFATLAIIVFAFFAPYMMMPKAFSWGGKLMSSVFTTVNNRVTKSVTDKGREGIKGMTERYRGTMAEHYQPNDNILKRGLFRVGSGHYNPLPGALGGRRSRALAIQAGDKSKDMKKAEADAVINRKADKAQRLGMKVKEYMKDENGALVLDRQGRAIPEMKKDATGHVLFGATGRPVEADLRELDGVAAYKQSLVDSSHSSDAREREMAITRLQKTGSWPEIATAVASNGLRVADSPEWDKTVITGDGLYVATQGKRYDLVPHIKSMTYDDKRLAKLGYTPGTGEYNDLKGKKLTAADRIRVAASDYMSPEDFASQSQGFWDEARQGGYPAKTAGVLQTRFEEIASTGQYGLQVLGKLRGGDTEVSVHRALGGRVDTNGKMVLNAKGQSKLGEYIETAQIATLPPGAATAAAPGVAAIPPPAPPVAPGAATPTVGAPSALSPSTWAGSVQQPVTVQGVTIDLPDTASLADSAQRQEFKQNILNNIDVRNTLAWKLGSGKASPQEKQVYRQNLDELRVNAATSPETTTAHDDLVDKIHAVIADRTNQIVAQAVASGRTAEEVQRIRNNAETAGLREMETYQKIGLGGSDGTLVVQHNTPPSSSGPGGSIPPEDFGPGGKYPPPNVS